MNAQLIDFLGYLIGFGILVVLQALAINGIKEALSGSAIKDDLSGKITYQGNILYMMAPKFFEKYKYRYWAKNWWTCIKCMSSTYGAATYWPIVVFVFGFYWIEVLIFVWDVFILTYLNYYFYKKI